MLKALFRIMLHHYAECFAHMLQEELVFVVTNLFDVPNLFCDRYIYNVQYNQRFATCSI